MCVLSTFNAYTAIAAIKFCVCSPPLAFVLYITDAPDMGKRTGFIGDQVVVVALLQKRIEGLISLYIINQSNWHGMIVNSNDFKLYTSCSDTTNQCISLNKSPNYISRA